LTSEINKGVEWCATNGARVINMSLGGTVANMAQKDLMAALVQNQNILVVAAAGNDGTTAFHYPASFPDVISVGSVNQVLVKSKFSNYNQQVDLSGPGENVLSTLPGNGYGYASGTSMATPHVAGAISKIWAARPRCTNMQVRAAVEGTASDLGPVGRDDEYGHGLVQVKVAYQVCHVLSYFVAMRTILSCFSLLFGLPCRSRASSAYLGHVEQVGVQFHRHQG
jgi:serine protease